jgi:hypothetical protein
MRQTSVRLLYLMPQAAVAKLRPAIAGSLGKRLGAKGERVTATEETPDRSFGYASNSKGTALLKESSGSLNRLP